MAAPRVPRNEPWSPGVCLLIVVAGCLMFWVAAVFAIRWAFS